MKTKSGSTETMAQFLIVWNMLKDKLAEGLRTIIATTDKERAI